MAAAASCSSAVAASAGAGPGPVSAGPGSCEWLLLRDGCLRCDADGLCSLCYHPALNAILAVTARGTIKVIDGTSGATLQASALNAKPGGRVKCQYISAVDKVIFVDDYAVGCRKDLNGILLLDTALQTPVSKQDDVVQLELPVTEAQQLLSACIEKVDVSSTEGYDLFIAQLKDGLKNTSHETAANHKVAKWATVTFHLPHHVLKSVASAIVNELKKINQNIAALPVASSVMDRLSYLLPSARPELGVGPGRSVDRSLMYSEANRRETFTSWPHVGYRWAQPDPMAQAGFYHQPASSGDDRAMCFTCSVCLVCWEPTDEPWSEHERHSPNCPFVKGEHTQNVPLSVTLATSPAQFPCTDGTDRIACFGSGSCPHFLAAATKRGKICIWDVSKLMKVHLKFEINAYDPAIVQQLMLSGEQSSGVDSRRPTLAWLEDSSSCSDIPKLEGDSDDLLEDSDSEEHSRSESVTGHTSQKETMEVSLDITALSILQQPEKLQWEIVANVLEDTVKDLEELGANPCLANCKSEKMKEKHLEQHSIPFPCLLAGGLLTYKSPATSPVSSNSQRSLDGLSRTRGESVSEQGSTDNESCTNSDLNSPLVRRTLPVLLLYSIKESDEKAGKLFSQMNNIMSKSIHDDGFTVPQIIEMELDSQEQLLLQDPPVTYIQQFADAAANLASPDSDKWSSMVPKPGTLVQCLRLPKFAEEENLCVDSITPCADGVHLLVGLRTCPVESLSAINQVEALNNLNKLNSALCNRRKGELESSLAVVNGTSIDVIQHESPADVPTPLIIQPEQRSVSGGYLVLYKMNYATRIVTLEEEPVKIQHIKDPQDTITSMILLPPDILDNREDDCEEPVEEIQLTSKNGSGRERRSEISTLGHLVITTQGGYVKILDLTNFEILAKVEPPKKEGTEEPDMFVSVIYCSGTDRLCACTKGGELHFLQIGGTCDDIDEADILVDGSLSKSVEQSSEGTKPLSNPSSPGITGKPRVFSHCLLFFPDSNSWDEHVFELVLPKACMVGHVDFKFVLNSNITNIPQIQVTLLKNKAPGLGKVNAHNIEVERNGKPGLVEFNEEMQYMDVEEPQCLRLCPFLEEHKEDILCGPVWLATGLDLSGHAGMLTLTSPKLVKGMAGGKYRSFLIHVKSVNDRGTEEICNGGIRPVVRIPPLKPQTTKGHSLASLLAKVAAGKEKPSSKIEATNSSRKSDNLRGCDLLQEVSVTIRRFKKTYMSKERVQRCAMLQFSEFHEKLLTTLCKKTDDGLATEHAQSLVLDTLCWLAGVYSNGPGSSKEGNDSLLFKTRGCVSDIIRVCFFEAGRSIAHKCARFLALCISNGRCDPSQQGFGSVLLKALLDNMPLLPAAATGGSVYWYFVLLNYVKDEDLAGCSTACASLLTAVSRQLQDRLTPMEALLQTRYGLYSSPFDPVLFDLEISGSSCKNVYNSSIGVQSDEIDLSDVLSGNGKISSCAGAEGSFTSLTGLLEVEPLHFTCVSTSDGTRIERDDASTFTVSTFGVTPAVGGLSSGTVGEASTALSSAAQVALQSLSHAMASAEQQLQYYLLHILKSRTNPLGSGLALAISHASHFLQPPPHQSIIIERMHSGARRFVTLDFGRPVLLTDVLIPTCGDLASLSIDIWTLGEEVDGRRLVVATDISTHSLILHDLLPPPVCRFMKITVIGRYGSTNARAKIPLGFYYGHTYILPFENDLKLMHDPLREGEAANQPEIDQHLAMMIALQEDIQCRYNLACHRLEILLQSIDLPPLNSANNAQYFLRKPDKAVEEDSRVFSAYQDCIQLQLQLNLAHHAVQRLKVALGASRKTLKEQSDPKELIQMSSTEQLRTIIRYLLDTLLSLLHSSNGHSVPVVLQSTFHAQACEELFKHLCISGTPKIRLHTGLLLVQLCGGERWWGQFLSNVLQELYNSEQLLIFPQDRVFMLLSCIGQRSLSNSGVLESLLNLLDNLLSPLQPHLPVHRRTEGVLDIPMISWVVMLVSRLLDYVATVEDEAATAKKPLNGKERERFLTGNQWSFINNSLHTQSLSRSTKGNSSLDRLYSRKIRKQLVHHKQQLNLLKAKQKALVEQMEKEKIQSNKGSSYKLLVEQAKLKQATSKHFKDLIRLRRTAEWPRSTLDTEVSTTKETPEIEPLPFTLAHERCISVVQKLALFLLSMDFTCHADLLLFVCKVLARIANATRPTIHLCEIVNETQLERLLLLLVGTDFNRGDISWGGAWAQYSLTCMLQDILAGELLAPIAAEAMEEGALGEDAGASAGDSDDSLQQSTVQLVETIDEPLTHDITGAPPLSSLEKDKDIDLELLQDLMEVDIDPLDIDLEKDPLAAKVFKPISSTWYDYWGADYGTYNYNPYIGGVGIPVAKPPVTTEKNGSQTVSVSVSQALDARLEVGLEQQAELMLKMMSTLEADSILQALTNTSPTLTQSPSGTDDSLLRGLHAANQNAQLIVQLSSIPMLSACFNKLFSMLQVHHVQLESLLQLWLTLSLNSSSSGSKDSGTDIFLYNANRIPVISLNQASVTSFLSVLAWYPNTLLRTWCLVLHSLTLMTNMQLNAGPSSAIGAQESTAQLLVSDPNLIHVLVKFLSGTNPHGTNQHSPQVGPTATQAMQEFLTRLQVHLSSACPQIFSEFLLKLIHILSTERTTTSRICGASGMRKSAAGIHPWMAWFSGRCPCPWLGGWNSMILSTRAIVNTARSMVSTIMKFLDSGPTKATDSSLKARVLASEPDNAEGIHNFAPLGSITSSSPTAQPAEVLLQATPPHRRARSAAWSYIFLPEEAWCDLTIHLPAAVLLKEIHIQPHLASLATCPSSVSVEISADGVNMLPLSTPVITSGLTYIKIQLVKAEVASAVCLRLHRPRDASTLGLSQIKLLGLTAFGNTSSATVNNPFLPSEDQVSKTSIGWLRLLHHCLTHISDLEGMMASAAAPTANLLQTCAALLMSPYCGMHSPNIEAVLVKIGLQSTRIGLKLIDILLRNCSASGSDPADLNSPLLFGRLNGLSSDSTIDILYQLGTTQDPGTKDRIQALLKWVSDSARVAAMKKSGRVSYICPNSSTKEYGLLMPSPSHLHCVAAILWHSYELLVEYDLPALLDRELFESLFNWSMSLPCNMVLKKAVDSLLCSMCHIHPNYFSLLMGWMGITPPPMQCQHRLSMTDDSKKQDLSSSLTDDSKNAQAPLALTESHLATLAASSQSPEAIKQLLDSGLPSLLVRSLASFCFNHTSSSDCTAQSTDTTQDRLRRHHVPQHFNKMPITADLVAPVLRFLTEVGNSHMMKDWLGGSEVNPLWTALLFLLCHSGATSGGHNVTAQQTSTRSSLLSSTVTAGLTTQQRTAIENATVAFFLQCISCHPNNQRLMAQVLCELFQSSPQRGNLPTSGSISGFIRRLFLQLMLEDEKVTLFLQSPCPLYKGRINATSHVIQHPMYGAGHKFRTLHLPVSTTLAEVLDRVSDTPSITAKLINEQKEDKEKKNYEEKEKVKAENGFQDNYSVVVASGLKSQSKRAVSSTPPRPPSRRGRVMAEKVGTSSSGGESSSKTISVPVFHLYHKLLPGDFNN
uniref:Baculoviral IAP repeat containing 6 n=1 Tax=Amazona collaria TaxID=241587 RepID=A0A8B9GGI7_9PSIT